MYDCMISEIGKFQGVNYEMTIMLENKWGSCARFLIKLVLFETVVSINLLYIII